MEKIVKIRQANREDVPQLEKLFLIARQQTFIWENPGKFKLEDYTNSTEGETVFVAEGEGLILGFISLYEHESPPFIHHFFVAPNHQRKGVGELLMNSLFSWLNPPYRPKCLVRNQNAIAFYLKNHWFAVGEGIEEEGEI